LAASRRLSKVSLLGDKRIDHKVSGRESSSELQRLSAPPVLP
jgi:hypothetical protein